MGVRGRFALNQSKNHLEASKSIAIAEVERVAKAGE
jgi:hypothetical protein